MCLILLCISLGMTRECAEAQEALMSCDGFSSLLRALQSSVEKLRVKAAFMLTCLCNENPVYKGDNSILFVNDPNSVFKLLTVFANVIRYAVRYGFCGAVCSPFAAGTGLDARALTGRFVFSDGWSCSGYCRVSPIWISFKGTAGEPHWILCRSRRVWGTQILLFLQIFLNRYETVIVLLKHQEEVEYCRQLLAIIFKGDSFEDDRWF